MILTKALDDRARRLRRETHGLEAVTAHCGATVGGLAAPADPDRDRVAGLRQEAQVVERGESPVKTEGVLDPRSPEQIDRLVEAFAAIAEMCIRDRCTPTRTPTRATTS